MIGDTSGKVLGSLDHVCFFHVFVFQTTWLDGQLRDLHGGVRSFGDHTRHLVPGTKGVATRVERCGASRGVLTWEESMGRFGTLGGYPLYESTN